MIRTFIYSDRKVCEVPLEKALAHKNDIVWIDILNPQPDEDKIIEEMLEITIPTRAEIAEIEVSSSLYTENGTVYTTATLVTQSETPEPQIHPVSFILHNKTLITLRYAEPRVFSLYANKICSSATESTEGSQILIDMLEIIIGRAADGLEKISHTIDNMVQTIFRPPTVSMETKEIIRTDFQEMLRQTGACGDFISKIRECLVTVGRLANFVEQTTYYRDKRDELIRLHTLTKDITSLRDYAGFLSDKASFLLQATLGMVNIEQNAIIKIFSVAAVIFLPPTLIASIYGMNFHHMPELDWHLGYPLALGLMMFSAYLPYRFFKKKGWL